MLRAGAAQVDISPTDSQFLFGYPHVKRYSTGIHDPLLSSALYLSDGTEQVLFIANDIIFITKEITRRVRKRISAQIGIPPENIMLTATHTHSGPITVDYLCVQADTVVPKADLRYIAFMEDRIVQAAVDAFGNAQAAKLGLGIADDTGVGTNRRNPGGPADHQVPVLLVKNANNDSPIACMLVCSMHPTVLHEDSTQVSADFPGMARLYLQEKVLGPTCPVLHHTGPAGNQSPRHVTAANTFQEAARLGTILARAAEKAIADIVWHDHLDLSAQTESLSDLPRKSFPSIQDAEQKQNAALAKLESLRAANAAKQEIRTAECDWFGAEEVVTLAKAARDGSLEKACQTCLPAEIQAFRIGPWTFVGWPGEIFIEYALSVKNAVPNTFVISLANGELQGYIATREAADEGGYEASNALFSHQTGDIFVDRTVKLLRKH